MTGQYLRNMTADYITGAVSACEGIRDSLVLLNGPLGCRFYHGYASGQSVLKGSELWGLRGELQLSGAMDDRLMRSQYFAGTPQIPGSNLRYEDNIFGTKEQLHRALNDIFSERQYAPVYRDSNAWDLSVGRSTGRRAETNFRGVRLALSVFGKSAVFGKRLSWI